MAGSKQSEAPKAPESLSQFLARVLDQLSVSSWLPSAALVATALLYLRLFQRDGSLVAVLESLSSAQLADLLVVLGAVVLMTVLAQAFEFEAIRLLEGYWDGGCRVERLAAKRRDHFREIKDGLDGEIRESLVAIAKSAAGELRIRNMLEELARALELLAASDGDSSRLTSVDRDLVADQSWMLHASPELLVRYRALGLKRDHMPDLDHRVLPTRLGNTLRSYEERVHDPMDPTVERFVQLAIDTIPKPLLDELQQFRGRLNLYCSLVMIFAFSAVAAVPLFWAGVPIATASVVTCGLLSLVSYRAAIASAHGYGTALLSAAEMVRRTQTRSVRAAA